jgi:hypothetical protein
LPDAGGGSENLNAILTEQENLISTLKERLEGKAAGVNDVSAALVDRTITNFSDPSLTTVGMYAFYYCTALASVNLPSVTTVGSYAFGNCDSLSKVELPLLTTINTYTFRGCTALQVADFGKVTSITAASFYKCSALTALIIRTPSVCYIADSATIFDYTPIAGGTGYIYVPRALIENYRAATNWATYANQFRAIEDYPDICGGGS